MVQGEGAAGASGAGAERKRASREEGASREGGERGERSPIIPVREASKEGCGRL